jgi:uroporphyrinogen-III synthase
MALQAIQRVHPNLSWVIDSPAPQAAHFDSESLWAQVSEQIRPGDAVLILRGLDAQEPLAVDNEGSGREWLAEQIRSHQGLVHYQAVYQRTAPSALPAWALNHPPHDLIWLFSSSQAVQHLHQCAPQATWQDSRALATHPRIAQAASEMGFGHVQLVPPQITPIARLVQDTVSR